MAKFHRVRILKMKHGDLTETQLNRTDTVVYHVREISGDKQYLVCYRFELDYPQGNPQPTTTHKPADFMPDEVTSPRNVSIQLEEARRERRKCYTVLVPNELYLDYLTSCLLTNLKQHIYTLHTLIV